MTKQIIQPGAGQGELFPHVLDAGTRRSFGWATGATNPLFLHEPKLEIDPAIAEIVEVDYLRASLFKDKPYGRNVIGGLAVNAAEYQLIPRNAQAIQNQVEAKTESSRQLDNNRERSSAAVSRASGYTLLGYADRDGLMSWLSAEKNRLQLLRKEAKTPGFAHLSEVKWNQLLTDVITFSFNNMREVAGDQRHWSPQQHEAAEQTMLYQLTRAKQQQRIRYWRDLTDLSLKYNESKTKVFKNRINIASSVGRRALTSGEYPK